MAVIARRAVEAFLRRPDAAIVLLYGPDTGLVSERAAAIVAQSVDDPKDPFQLVRLEGEDLSSDPARLADEAYTVPLFGGRRAIRVRAGGRYNLVSAVEPILAAPSDECRIVIEGGEWRKSHALVALLSRARQAAVIGCWGDEATDIGQLIADEAAAAGLAVAPEAREALVGLLGGDRLASRAELQKLALYAHGAGRIELSDVEAVVGDASAIAFDEVIDAAFGGRPGPLDRALQKSWAEKTNPSVLAGMVLRHALALHRLRGAVDAGRPAAPLVQHPSSGIPLKRQQAVAAQLQNLGAPAIERIVADLGDAVLEARRQQKLGAVLVSRALMRVALSLRRGR